MTSTLGQGATFTIYLPQAAAPCTEEKADAAIGSETAATGRGYRVLVVEDNDDVGTFLDRAAGGPRLQSSAGWPTPMRRWQFWPRDEFAVDLVFSDVIMPGMNGVELAGIIRERYPGLPVVLTSGYSNVLAENAHRGFELIQKPYSVESLSRILRKAMVKRSSAVR